jgi:hypothetical protein
VRITSSDNHEGHHLEYLSLLVIRIVQVEVNNKNRRAPSNSVDDSPEQNILACEAILTVQESESS